MKKANRNNTRQSSSRPPEIKNRGSSRNQPNPKPHARSPEQRKPGKGVSNRKLKRTNPDHIFLYGVHAVLAALENDGRHKIRLLATENGLARLNEKLVQRSGVTVEQSTPHELDALLGQEAVHQGLVLECSPLEVLDASELFHLADSSLILVLDQITDPHNVGAILRSAVAFDVAAVLMTHRNSAQETGVLAKSASGALDQVRSINIRNLSKAIDELNAMGFETLGLDSEGPMILEDTIASVKPKKIALVLGAEGKGLRHQTREACNHLARLDMPGPIKSLNVSNAAVLSLYIASSSL